MEQSTASKVDLEVDLFLARLPEVYSKSALVLVAVSLDVHDAMELLVRQIDVNLNDWNKLVNLKGQMIFEINSIIQSIF